MPLTKLAVKFGEQSEDEATENIPSGSSGLTPTPYFKTSTNLPPTEFAYRSYQSLSGYQRSYMSGFTTVELVTLFAIENPNAAPSTLDSIGPDISVSLVLQKSNWKIAIPNMIYDGDYEDLEFFDSMSGTNASDATTAARRPKIPGIMYGFTDVECEPVWEAMLPALRLATYIRLDFLNDIQTPEFWDVIVTKFSSNILIDNKAPYSFLITRQWIDKDKTVPGTLRRAGVWDENEVQKVARHAAKPAQPNDEQWKFRDRRIRRTKQIIDDFELYKRFEYRTWKQYHNPRVPSVDNLTRRNWGVPMKDPGLTYDEILAEIAEESNISVEDLKKRGPIGNLLLRRWFVTRGFDADEYFANLNPAGLSGGLGKRKNPLGW